MYIFWTVAVYLQNKDLLTPNLWKNERISKIKSFLMKISCTQKKTRFYLITFFINLLNCSNEEQQNQMKPSNCKVHSITHFNVFVLFIFSGMFFLLFLRVVNMAGFFYCPLLLLDLEIPRQTQRIRIENCKIIPLHSCAR